MYAQALNTVTEVSKDDPAKLAAFQARIDAEEKIEPNDWMPEGYRKTLQRQISQHAHYPRAFPQAQGRTSRQGAG